MLDAIKTFLEGCCPLLANQRLALHFLGEQPGALGLFASKDTSVLRRFTDGGGLYGYGFSILLRTAFDGDEKDAKEHIHFLEKISGFLEQAEENGVFPALSEGEIPRRFIINTPPALVSNNTKTATLQMTCSLLYEKEGCKH